MRTKLLIAVAGTTLSLLAASTPAYADTTADLLLRLKEKGILTEDEYNTLLNRRTEEVRAAPAATPAASANAANVQTETKSAAETVAGDDKSIVRMAEGGGMTFGGVTLKVSGSVNGFYTYDKGEKPGLNTTVDGGLATVGSQSTSSVRNGLLPGFIKFDVTTTQLGIDVGAHFGLYPGINSVTNVGGANSPGNPVGLSTSGIDARQTYLTFGTKQLGTVKIGRDIGLFGSDAILNDITLLGVGTASGNAGPSNTSLGRIGIGYIYTDWIPQITYTTPSFAGLQVSAGVFTPLATAGRNEVNGSPGFQAKVSYDYKDDQIAVRAWVGGITQKHDEYLGIPQYTGRAVDLGAKLTYGPLGVTGYYYTGKGVGTTGLFILATDDFGNKRKSDGFYVQGTLGFGKVTVAGSYGESNLDLARGEINPTLVSKNSSYVGQLRYGLTPWVTLLSEYTHTISEAHGINEAESDSIAAGAILFF